ncbi:DUF4376 domain-containing protein [Agrobacterium rhizogenes]|uniref:DUF4376 domain-containing protein n=1 Tax=Rhizobium rhizogenes TaxID=359 RepID=UPI0015740B43|nr:DUF4376 domain-containing protein [Rhizobium rhizogenes]NTG48957.1 DUF4376 domain-containing protein [Rhizobium rhizogenes]
MSIESAKYKEDGAIVILRDGEMWTLPADASGFMREDLSSWEALGGTIEPFVAPTVTSNQVDEERDRRIDMGFTFNGVRYDSDAPARENLSGAATAALSAIIAGATVGDYNWLDPSSEFEWIAQDNTKIPLDAQSTFALGQAALSHKSAHIFAARAIKDQSPIPSDFADDSHWPD